MLGTPVPVAAVDEDGDARGTEQDVHRAAEVLLRLRVHPVAEAGGMEETANGGVSDGLCKPYREER